MKVKSFFALKDEKLSEICLAVTGEWLGHSSGAFALDKSDLEKMKINFDKKKTDLVIDYEHQSLNGSVAPAAGWIKEMFLKDNELWGRVEWTDKAKEFIKNREYKYLSPVYEFFGIDEKTGACTGVRIHSASLTNTPFIDELGEVVANKNSRKDESMDKKLDNEKLGEEIKALKEKIEAKDGEIKALKEELANSKVANAIANKKINDNQKEWALKYCKSDMKGFDEFVKTAKVLETPKNNLFANKVEPGNESFDPVKIATNYINN